MECWALLECGLFTFPARWQLACATSQMARQQRREPGGSPRSLLLDALRLPGHGIRMIYDLGKGTSCVMPIFWINTWESMSKRCAHLCFGSFAKLSLNCPGSGSRMNQNAHILGFEECFTSQSKPASSVDVSRYHCRHGAGMQWEVEPCPAQLMKSSSCSECSVMEELIMLWVQHSWEELIMLWVQLDDRSYCCWPHNLRKGQLTRV